MATIRERRTKAGEARFEVQVRLAGEPARVATFRKRRDAERWAQEQEVQARERHRFGRVLTSTVTVGQAIDRYLDERLVELSPADQAKRRAILLWWRERFGHLRLRDFGADHISRGLKAIAEGGAGPARQNRYLSALSRALELAKREWRWIEHNPARDVVRRREPPGRVRALTDPERARLLAACRASSDPELYPLVLLALATGARQGELVALRWESVDFASRLVTFQQTKNRERRSAAISAPVLVALQSLGPQESGPVFTHTVFRAAWDRARAEAKLEDFRFHDLRHTAASYLALSGASLLDIATILGHKSMAMVKRYAHLNQAHLGEVSERMADRFLTPTDRDDPSTIR